MAFIKFTEHGRSFAPRASISRTGTLSFSYGARNRHLADYKFCVLYYDPDTRRIGIELTNDDNAEGHAKSGLGQRGQT